MKPFAPLIIGLLLVGAGQVMAQQPATVGGADADSGQNAGGTAGADADLQQAAGDNGPSRHQEAQADFATAYADYNAGKFKTAAADLRYILKLEPSYADAHQLLAFTYLKMNDSANAIPQLESYIKSKPDQMSARENLGFAYLQANRPTDALTQFRAVLAKAPKDTQAQLGEAEALRVSGDKAGALASYQKTIALDPKNAAAWLSIGILETQTGANDKAIPALQQALALGTDDQYDAHLALAEAYSNTKDATHAMSEMSAASQLRPSDPAPVFNLAVLQGQTGDNAGAEQSYRQALALKPTDPTMVQQAQTQLGLLLAADGNADAAVPALSQAAVTDPANAQVELALGTMYEKQGKKPEAAAAYKKALALDSTLTRAQGGLARVSQ